MRRQYEDANRLQKTEKQVDEDKDEEISKKVNKGHRIKSFKRKKLSKRPHTSTIIEQQAIILRLKFKGRWIWDGRDPKHTLPYTRYSQGHENE